MKRDKGEKENMNTKLEKTTAYYLKSYGEAQSLERFCIKEKESNNSNELLNIPVENIDFVWAQRNQALISRFPLVAAMES